MSEPVPFASAPSGAARRRWSLRRARPGDAEAWHALQATIYAEGRAFVGDGAPSPGALAARLRSLEPNDGVVVFAVAAGAPVAWAEAYRLGSKRLAHVAMLTIAVADGWRGHGVGTELMVALEAWAHRARVRKLQLHVRARNQAAIALYRRLGYAVEGVLAEQVAADGGFEDEWVMARSLTADAR
ncbi:MAG: N-acetyltransferase family protein [Trueperaceae bacterium]